MAVGGINPYASGSYFGLSNPSSFFGAGGVSQSNALSQIYDYKSAQDTLKSLLNPQKKNSATLSALKKDTSDFLTQYTSTMNNLQTSAAKLTNGGIDKILFDSEGNTSEESIKNTVSAVKDMVGEYNKTLDFLNSNAERGVGVETQIARMAADPAARQKLDAAGISVNKDGTLSLNETKLTSALSDKNPLQVKLVADAVGDWNGIAGGIAKDAQAGLNTPAAKLINNDIAEMQDIQNNDPVRQMYTAMRGGGAYYFNNMAAGMMMNMLA